MTINIAINAPDDKLSQITAIIQARVYNLGFNISATSTSRTGTENPPVQDVVLSLNVVPMEQCCDGTYNDESTMLGRILGAIVTPLSIEENQHGYDLSGYISGVYLS